MTTLFDKIKEVTELSATSGFEAPVRDYLRNNITPLVDEVQTDGLGGIFGIKHSQAENAPKVLVAAHMDEVGFMIKEIKADGLSVSSNLVVGTHWLSAHNASPYTLVTVVSILSSQVQFHLISYVLVAELQVFLVFLISSLMLVLPTKKKQMPTVFSQVMSSFLNLKRFSQPIKRMSFLKLGITVMVFS